MKHDLVGQTFSHLTVLEDSGKRSSKGNIIWTCLCSCGNKTDVKGTHLISGNIKSCGCMHYRYGHGETGTRLYNIWCTMKARCLKKGSSGFYKYGARGISVCKEWSESYEKFAEWARRNGYSDSLTIDRIDNNGDYCPENCRWVSLVEQANNKRSNHIITVNGITGTIADMSRRFGVNPKLIYKRIWLGWTPEEAFSCGSTGR